MSCNESMSNVKVGQGQQRAAHVYVFVYGFHS